MRRVFVLVATLAAAAPMVVFGAGSGRADTDPAVSPVTFDVCGTKSWVVPAGVTSATFDLLGAAGGDGGPTGQFPPALSAPGGRGGHTTATLAVTPGETLTIVVGCQGGSILGGSNAVGGAAAPGGTGSGTGGDSGAANNVAGGGGGGTAVLRGSTVLLAAGGGGGGSPNGTNVPDPGQGGSGGGANQDGTDGNRGFCGDTSAGGGGATTSAVGAGGTQTGGTPGSPGSGGDGGAGAGTGADASGGGGGGGYFGGGGGAAFGNSTCGGGGGGSGFADPTATNVSGSTGVRAGDGLATVTFAPGASAPTPVVAQPTTTG